MNSIEGFDEQIVHFRIGEVGACLLYTSDIGLYPSDPNFVEGTEGFADRSLKGSVKGDRKSVV